VNTPPHTRRSKTTPGALRLLFSTDYSQFLLPRLLRAGYRTVIAMTAFTVLVWVLLASALPDWIGWGIPALVYIFAPFLGLVTLALTRITLEYLTVVFDISTTLHKIDAKAEYLTDNAHQNNQAARHAPTDRT
jgi:uncharacterized membrane protein YcaP (DUF421 family)